MKICLITDTHFGARGDNAAFADYFARFYNEVFFPYMEKNDISTVVHLGDIVDRRKFINFVTARRLEKDFIKPMHDKGINAYFIVGNHDTYFKNTNEVNSMRELYGRTAYDNITIIDTPQEFAFDGCNILMMPWVCSGNYMESLAAMEDSTSQVMFGHFEIKGFEMYKGSVSDSGFETNLFKKFDLVCSGHFHHKSSNGNINYLGAPYEMVWSDFDDPRGFHVFDTETRELTFVRNPLRMFHKIWYDDSKWEDHSALNEMDFSEHKGTFVKVIVTNKSNPYWFDLFIEKLEKSGVLDMQVVDDHLNLDLEDDSDIVNEAEDTLTILKKFVDVLEIKTDRVRLDNLLSSLYNEALTVE